MAATVHIGPELETKQAVKKGQNCQIRQNFLLTVGGSERLVGLGQISLTSK